LRADTVVARGAVSLYAATTVTLVLNVAHFVILANLLSTLEIGVLAGANILLLAYGTVIGLALPQAVLKYVADFSGSESGGAAREVVWLSLKLTLVLATPVAVAMYLYARPLAEVLLGSPEQTIVLQLTAADSWLFVLSQVFLASLYGLNRIPRASAIQAGSAGLRFTAAAALVLLGLGLPGALIGYVVGDITLLGLGLLAALRYLPKATGGKDALISARVLLAFSLPLTVSALIIFGITQLDKIYVWIRPFLQLGQGVALSDLAIYNIAAAAASIAAHAPNAITTALVPSLSPLSLDKDRAEFAKLAKQYTRYVALLATPTAFGLAALAMPLVQLFGPQYLPGALPAGIMAIAIGITAASAVYLGELLAMKQTRAIMYANVAGLLTFFAALTVLVPLLQLPGAAWARGVMTVVSALALALYVRRRGVFVFDTRAFASALVAAAVMAAVLVTASVVIGGYLRQIAALPVLIPAGVAIYFLGLRLLGAFTSEDLEFLRRLLPARLNRLVDLVARLAGVRPDG
jgi:O-antigen/teichoic acid export membrane protein